MQNSSSDGMSRSAANNLRTASAIRRLVFLDCFGRSKTKSIITPMQRLTFMTASGNLWGPEGKGKSSSDKVLIKNWTVDHSLSSTDFQCDATPIQLNTGNFILGHTFPDFSFSRLEEIGKTGNDYAKTRNFTAMFLIKLLPRTTK